MAAHFGHEFIVEPENERGQLVVRRAVHGFEQFATDGGQAIAQKVVVGTSQVVGQCCYGDVCDGLCGQRVAADMIGHGQKCGYVHAARFAYFGYSVVSDTERYAKPAHHLEQAGVVAYHPAHAVVLCVVSRGGAVCLGQGLCCGVVSAHGVFRLSVSFTLGAVLPPPPMMMTGKVQVAGVLPSPLSFPGANLRNNRAPCPPHFRVFCGAERLCTVHGVRYLSLHKGSACDFRGNVLLPRGSHRIGVLQKLFGRLSVDALYASGDGRKEDVRGEALVEQISAEVLDAS